MKTCPNCGATNLDDANFCENCGFPLKDVAVDEVAVQPTADNDQPSNRAAANSQALPPRQQPPKKKRWPIILGILGVLVIATMIVVGFFLFYSGGDKKTAESTQASSASTAESSSEDLTKYDNLIAEAKQLTIDGNYKDSAKKLATIPTSDLSKQEFAAVKEAVDQLTIQNNNGIAKQEAKSEAEKNQAAAEQKRQEEEKAAEQNSSKPFSGDFAKWARTYEFYYRQSGQKQQELIISSNGDVIQHSSNTSYTGQATVAVDRSQTASYVTDNYYVQHMPKTKSIIADVAITIVWDNNGGTQVVYGYVSNSGMWVLTDGLGKGDGINEVWVSR